MMQAIDASPTVAVTRAVPGLTGVSAPSGAIMTTEVLSDVQELTGTSVPITTSAIGSPPIRTVQSG